MSAFLLEYGMFFAKVLTVASAVLVALAAVLVALGAAGFMWARDRKSHRTRLKVTKRNEAMDDYREVLLDSVVDEVARKRLAKEKKAKKKAEKKARKKALKAKDKAGRREGDEAERKRRIYVLDFRGDGKASAVKQLREEITSVLTLAEECDEVLVRVESCGGTVSGYGLAASQLQRIRDRHIPLTVCVDKVAASGGYMMACVADKLLAAPFAMLGSIGVVAELPNFHRLLKKHDVDYESLTAGQYKRTLTLFAENTDRAREKTQKDLEDIHAMFRDFVSEHRPQLDMDLVATGECWAGIRALGHRLVDALMTSDQYLADACKDADVFHVTLEKHETTWRDRLGLSLDGVVEDLLRRWLGRDRNSRFF